MVHLWQHHYGTPSRSAYHNKEWAAKMHAIGLTPTDTGRSGGKETGQRVTHMIVEGGPFDLACAALLDTGVGIAWVERGHPTAHEGGEGEGGEGAEGEGTGKAAKAARAKAASKTKFCCPGCGANAWGKPDLRITCGACNVPVVSSEADCQAAG
jgi:hypothetical protein